MDIKNKKKYLIKILKYFLELRENLFERIHKISLVMFTFVISFNFIQNNINIFSGDHIFKNINFQIIDLDKLVKKIDELNYQKPPVVLVKNTSSGITEFSSNLIFPLIFNANAKINENGSGLLDRGVKLTKEHKKILEQLLISLKPFAGKGKNEKLILQVRGYASSIDFKNLNKNCSNKWNLKAAHERGGMLKIFCRVF